MGNTLTASNPADIRPVETYLCDLASRDTIESLGSTRFMKVAKGLSIVENETSLNVYKVFIKPDDNVCKDMNLQRFRDELSRIRKATDKSPNCCAVRKTYARQTENILTRPFHKYTLTDRITTRPFLDSYEKIWYVYQLFRALEQCHQKGVCHGDLKSQNVVISSSNWLQITDFAPFKPTYLPSDNPSSFTFFFDSSRRQSCFLAPERFMKDFEQKFKDGGDDWLFAPLTHAMDMFSAGCVVYELLCDGKVPFDYGELCDYRSKTELEAAVFLTSILSKIPKHMEFMVPLLKMLLNRHPNLRTTAENVFDGSVVNFPKVLDFIFNYLNLLAFRPKDALGVSKDMSTTESIEYIGQSTAKYYWDPDGVINKLVRDLPELMCQLEESDDSRPYAVLFVSLITSNIRSLRTSIAKIDAMNLLVKFAALCSPTVSIDKVLPYLMHQLNTRFPQVSAASIYAMTSLLEALEPTNVEESLIFVDYVFPELKMKRATDVEVAIATCLGTLTESAHRFMRVGRGLRNGTADDECSNVENVSEAQLEDREAATLSLAVADIFTLLSDTPSSPTVRLCLVNPESVAKLHRFFHRIGNSEMMPRHLFTLLNIRTDWRLRAAFFDALPLCVDKNTVNVKSLLEQGVTDGEELVVVRALACIVVLVARDTLEKETVLSLLKTCLPFLAHPSEWIRLSVVNFIVLLDARWSVADVHCKLLPLLADYIDAPGNSLIRVNNRIVFMQMLRKSIPYETWQNVIVRADLKQTKDNQDRILHCLRTRTSCQISKQDIPAIVLIQLSKFAEPIENGHLRRGNQDNFGERETLMKKMAICRQTGGMEGELTRQNGVLDLSSSAACDVKRKCFDLRVDKRQGDLSVETSRSTMMNSEWNELFAAESVTPRAEKNHMGRSMRSSESDNRVHEMLRHKAELFRKGRSQPDTINKSQLSRVPNTVKGVQLSHLHEHSQRINQLALHPDSQRFASAARDGCVKLWSRSAVTGDCYGAVRSETTFAYSRRTNEMDAYYVNSLGWADGGSKLAMSGNDGRIVWVDMGLSSPNIITQLRIPAEEGAAEEIHVNGNIVFVRTHHSYIYCLDTRVGRSNGSLGRHEVWRRRISKNYGLTTSFCVDPHQQNWMAVCAINFCVLLWDLRYRQELCMWNGPEVKVDDRRGGGGTVMQKLRPTKIWADQTGSLDEPNGPPVFVAFEYRGEVAVYNLSECSPTRKKVLWPSVVQPFQYTRQGDGDRELKNETMALAQCPKSGAVFTGDTAGAIRKWRPNTTSSIDCASYLSGPRMDERGYGFREASHDRPMVIYEERKHNRDLNHRPAIPISNRGATYHRTTVTDLMSMGTDLLVSASADGVIKVWK